MCLNVTGNKIFDSTILPGGALGLALTLATMFYNNLPGSTPLFVDLWALIFVVIVSCVLYYYFELRDEVGFTKKSIMLCMFLASFSFVSNVVLVIISPVTFAFDWFYLLVPAVVLVACFFMFKKYDTATAVVKVRKAVKKAPKKLKKKTR